MKSTETKYFIPESIEDETQFWCNFKKGDKSAYAFFYKKYSSLLFRYGCKVISDREVVKDCMHDLFTEIWRNKEKLGNPVSVKNYLVKALRNKLVRQVHNQLRFIGQNDLEEKDLGYIESGEFVLVCEETRIESHRKLVKALRSLSHKQKEIIFLLYYNNLSPAEVASIMSVSVRTIYNTTFNAIQSLKSEMIVWLIMLHLLGR